MLFFGLQYCLRDWPNEESITGITYHPDFEQTFLRFHFGVRGWCALKSLWKRTLLTNYKASIHWRTMNNILHAQGMLVPGLESNRHILDHRLIRTFSVLFPQSFSIFWSIWLSGLKKLSVPKSWRQEDLDFSLFTDANHQAYKCMHSSHAQLVEQKVLIQSTPPLTMPHSRSLRAECLSECPTGIKRCEAEVQN